MFQREDDAYLEQMENFDYSASIVPTQIEFKDYKELDEKIPTPSRLTERQSAVPGTSSVLLKSTEPVEKMPVEDEKKKAIGSAKTNLKRLVTHF